MKPLVCLGVFFLFFISSFVRAAEQKELDDSVELKTMSQKFSYAMGLDVANALKRLETQIDLDAFFEGAKDGIQGKTPQLDIQEILAVKKEVALKEKARQEKKIKEAAEENQKAGDLFLAENKQKGGVMSTASGLQYRVVKQGAGPLPQKTDRVRIHYKGMTIDGSEFESSYKRGQPAVVPVNGILPGLSEAVRLMPVGSKYQVFIPANLGYGTQGAGAKGQVPPNSALIFEVELLEIVQNKNKKD